MVEQYLTHAKFILTDKYSVHKPNRTGIDSISRFGYQNEYDLAAGFPLLTSKRIPWKSVAQELLWFLRGETNIKSLVDNGVHIWDGNAFQHYLKRQGLHQQLPMYSADWLKAKEEYVQKINEDADFAQQHGSLGEVYGAQWRHWKTSTGKEIDQLADVIDLLQRSPSSRRLIVTSWNPEEIPEMALPPCHTFYQLNVAEGRLDLHLYQRSCDMFLGVPFNIASYALLTQILARQAALTPGRLVHSFGDAHFYCGAGKRGEFYAGFLDSLRKQILPINYSSSREEYHSIAQWIEQQAPSEPVGKEGQDHVTAILEQLSREPRPLPQIKIGNKRFDALTIDDFIVEGYDPHPSIKRAMAV